MRQLRTSGTPLRYATQPLISSRPSSTISEPPGGSNPSPRTHASSRGPRRTSPQECAGLAPFGRREAARAVRGVAVRSPGVRRHRLGLSEVELVPEGIDRRKLRSPGSGLGVSGTPVGIVLGAQLRVESLRSKIVDGEAGARSAVPEVLGETKNEPVPRDLHVEGRVGIGAVLPVDMKSGAVEVALAGLPIEKMRTTETTRKAREDGFDVTGSLVESERRRTMGGLLGALPAPWTPDRRGRYGLRVGPPATGRRRRPAPERGRPCDPAGRAGPERPGTETGALTPSSGRPRAQRRARTSRRRLSCGSRRVVSAMIVPPSAR